MKMKTILLRFYWVICTQFGLDLLKTIQSFRGIPRYIRDYCRFRSGYAGRLELLACLHDWYEEGGSAKNEYFWQDLIVARKIFYAMPEKHVDIGSRVDGFVAHVASFREIEVLDVRPITAKIPNILFKEADLMKPLIGMSGYCDSLSCLHALEHFGLGRYGDPIDPHGYERGIANMSKIIKPGGNFYLSTPIGQERVEFNAHRVFDPRTIIRCAETSSLELKELTVIGSDGTVRSVAATERTLRELAECRYNLGMFIFSKLEH